MSDVFYKDAAPDDIDLDSRAALLRQPPLERREQMLTMALHGSVARSGEDPAVTVARAKAYYDYLYSA